MGGGPLDLMQHQLHPQFGHLVDDDEEHFVMLLSQRSLAIEQPVQTEIAAIGHGLVEIPVDILIGHIDLRHLMVGHSAHPLAARRAESTGPVSAGR